MTLISIWPKCIYHQLLIELNKVTQVYCNVCTGSCFSHNKILSLNKIIILFKLIAHQKDWFYNQKGRFTMSYIVIYVLCLSISTSNVIFNFYYQQLCQISWCFKTSKRIGLDCINQEMHTHFMDLTLVLGGNDWSSAYESNSSYSSS